MKKPIILLIILIIITLTACAVSSPTAVTSPSLVQSVMPSVSPSVSPSESLSAPYGEEPSDEESLTPSPTESASKLPSASPSVSPPHVIKTDPNAVIIASGDAVIGGWSKGKWLTHDKAAAQCRTKKTFYSYDLTGLLGTDKSRGLVDMDGNDYDDDSFDESSDFFDKEYGYANSWSCDYGDIHTFDEYYLDDDLSEGFLCTLPPDKFPSVTLLSDTSALIPTIQSIVDEDLGEGAQKVNIRSAAQCDIDGDGDLETIVNADNCEDKVGDEEHNNVYCIACIIETDGSVHTINNFYIGGNKEPSDVEYESIDNVIDFDGDSKCEIVVDWTAFNAWETIIYKYDGDKFTKVLSYDIEA